jgi:hypothetical protein
VEEAAMADRSRWRAILTSHAAQPKSWQCDWQACQTPAEVALARQLDLSGLTWMLIQPCDRQHSVDAKQN